MKYLKKIVSVFLLAAIVLGMFSTVAIPSTYADSNDRIRTFLKMAAGGQMTKEDVSGLTTDQLVFLGIYLSNFYQPFGTEFGGSNDEIAANCKEDMVKALQTKLAFSPEMSEILVEYILEMTRQSVQYLDVYEFDGSSSEYKKLEDVYGSYYNYLRMMVGNSDYVMEGFKQQVYGDQGPFGGSAYSEKGYKDGYRSLRALLEATNEATQVHDTGTKEAGINGGGKKLGDQYLFVVKPEDSYSFITESSTWDSNGEYLSFPFGIQTNFIDTTLDSITGNTNYWVGNESKVLYIADKGLSTSQMKRLTGESFYSSMITDWEFWLKTLYLYMQKGYSYNIKSPYAGINDYCFKSGRYEGSPEWPNSFMLQFYADSTFNSDGTVSSRSGYWGVFKPERSALTMEPQGKPRRGDTDFSRVLSLCISVDMNKWEQCEHQVKLMSEKGRKAYYWGYEKDGEVKIVSNCSSQWYLALGGNYTPSQQQFMKCLETVDLTRGYGINILDFNKSDSKDGSWDKESLKELGRVVAGDSLYSNKEVSVKATIFGQRMAVDCFGNIIVLGANHQYIAVPACMNPYVWIAVNKDGSDVVAGEGAFLNIINAKNIVQVDSGALSNIQKSGNYITDVSFGILSSYHYDATADIMHLTGKVNNFVTTTTGYNGIGVVLSSQEVLLDKGKSTNCLPGRIVRGQGDHVVVENSWWPWTEDATLHKGIQSVVKVYCQLHPSDRTVVNAANTSKCFGWWADEFIPVIKNVSRLASPNGGGYLATNSAVNILDGYVFIDNLGAYKNPDGTDHEFHTFNIEHYISPETGTPAGTIAGGVKLESDFGSHAQMLVSGRMNNLSACTEQALCSIYVSYVYAYFYTEENKVDTIGRLGYRVAKENLPSVTGSDMSDIGTSLQENLEELLVDTQLTSIRDWTYYLLHPTEGFNYVSTLLSNKMNHLLLGWHADMVGTNGVGITTGTTKYRSNVGYVTMPDLSEIEWTDKLISFYQDCIPFLIILIVVLMLFAYITGTLSLQRAALAAILFSAFLLLPTTLINGAVQQSNAISQRIYGEKFTYWAMVQQETYARQIDEAANSQGSTGTSTYENYLRTLYGLNQQVYSNQGGESIVLKWQAPKKMSSLVLSEADAKSLEGLSDVGISMLNGMLGNAYGGQSFVSDTEAVYMYRSYIDISNFSRYIYGGIDDGSVQSTKSYSAVGSIMNGSFSNSLTSSVANMGTTYEAYRSQGYTGWGKGESAASPNYDYITVPMSSIIMADAVRNSAGLSSFDSKDDLIAINQDIFNFGIPMFTNDTVHFDLGTFAGTGGIVQGTERYNNLSNFMASYSSNENAFVGLAAYAVYSENPFYYFSWKLYHDGLGYGSSLYNINGYKDLLLGQSDGGYFYMTQGNGGLKDFMDMKSLFTYIIPYMKECNDLVREWDDTYGIFIYDGVPTEEGHWADVQADPELTAKYWHNLNVSRLYCLYCPWVDIMYDCSYAQPQTINVMGRKVTIEDPLNPASYPVDRPMIFSEAEMKDYGLSEADLTNAEKLILKCNEDMQERMYELLNYYNFSDITLNTAAAMQCAFAFNITFSETGIMSNNHNIYPQSYDLSNFSYDAFLRFILAESTGESLLNNTATTGTAAGATSGDFYERVVNNSSTTTAVLLLVLDLISIYALPAFKMFFLIAIFISSILIVFVSLCKIEDNAKFLRKVSSSFLMPLLKFFAITVGFSLAISLFMGKGNNSVTQTDELSISMGDPVIAILVIIALDILVLVLYWKIISGVLKDIRYNGKMAFDFAGGVIGAVGGMALGAVAGAVGVVKGTKSFIDNRVDRHYEKLERKQLREYDKSESSSDKPQTGTGVESPRAATRGSAPIDDKHETQSNRGIDPRKRTKSPSQDSGEDSEAKRQKIDNAAKSGAESMKKSDDKKQSKVKGHKPKEPQKNDKKKK